MARRSLDAGRTRPPGVWPWRRSALGRRLRRRTRCFAGSSSTVPNVTRGPPSGSWTSAPRRPSSRTGCWCWRSAVLGQAPRPGRAGGGARGVGVLRPHGGVRIGRRPSSSSPSRGGAGCPGRGPTRWRWAGIPPRGSAATSTTGWDRLVEKLELAGMRLNLTKTGVVASSAAGLAAARAAFADAGVPVVPSVRDLGVDVCWGRRRQGTRRQRLGRAKQQADRVSKLPSG